MIESIGNIDRTFGAIPASRRLSKSRVKKSGDRMSPQEGFCFVPEDWNSGTVFPGSD
ncbi:MAG: hypothetical protein P8P54_09540 [Pseudomonadales bacterium]|nr:hypothetical protein [Pseudomonadales bacterium]